MNTIITLDSINFKIDKKEALRYMGGGVLPDSSLNLLVENAMEQITEVAKPKGCYLKTPIEIKGNKINFGFETVISSSLAKSLENCSFAYLFSATIGVDFDRLLNKLLVSSPSKALALDAAGSAAIEGVCNSICNHLSKEINRILKPRFSPGYGDLDISFQKNLINILDTKRKIGLGLTEGFMLTPIKSVTAIVGIPNTKQEV